jgi:tetratricopeptide (TPR) repeat protein
MKRIGSIIIIVAIALGVFAACSNTAQPTTAAELLNLGEKYLLEMEYEQAIVQFTKLIEIEPKNPRGYTGSAEAYVALGDTDKAVEVLERGLKELPDDPDIQDMLAELDNSQSQSGSNSASPASGEFRDSLSDEQQILLDNLEKAAMSFDYEPALDIMTETAFLELYAESNDYMGWKEDTGREFMLSFWEDEDEKDYWWYRFDMDGTEIECQLWIWSDRRPSIAIRHMTMTDWVCDGEYVMVQYNSQDNTAYRYEGMAVDNLKQGQTIKTDLSTGERWVYRFEQGKCTNYQVDESGYAYIQSENGDIRQHVNPNDAMQAGTIH